STPASTGAGESVAVTMAWVPASTLSGSGASAVTSGATTLTCELADEPFRRAARLVAPRTTPVTSIATCVWPAANATEAGAVATPGSPVTIVSTPASTGAGESVAVTMAWVPASTLSGSGASAVTSGATTLTCELADEPFRRAARL